MTLSGGMQLVFRYLETSTVGAVNYSFLPSSRLEIATYSTRWLWPESCFFKGITSEEREFCSKGFFDCASPGITPVVFQMVSCLTRNTVGMDSSFYYFFGNRVTVLPFFEKNAWLGTEPSLFSSMLFRYFSVSSILLYYFIIIQTSPSQKVVTIIIQPIASSEPATTEGERKRNKYQKRDQKEMEEEKIRIKPGPPKILRTRLLTMVSFPPVLQMFLYCIWTSQMKLSSCSLPSSSMAYTHLILSIVLMLSTHWHTLSTISFSLSAEICTRLHISRAFSMAASSRMRPLSKISASSTQLSSLQDSLTNSISNLVLRGFSKLRWPDSTRMSFKVESLLLQLSSRLATESSTHYRSNSPSMNSIRSQQVMKLPFFVSQQYIEWVSFSNVSSMFLLLGRVIFRKLKHVASLSYFQNGFHFNFGRPDWLRVEVEKVLPGVLGFVRVPMIFSPTSYSSSTRSTMKQESCSREYLPARNMWNSFTPISLCWK